MKKLILTLALAFAVHCAAPRVEAQWVEAPSHTGGSSFTPNTAMVSLFSTVSASYNSFSISALGDPFDPPTTLPFIFTNTGTINQTTGDCFQTFDGFLQLANSTVSLQFAALAFQNLGGVSKVTGEVWGNSTYYGRIVLFTLNANPLQAPITFTGSLMTFTGPLFVSSDLSSALSGAFGLTVPAGTSFGTFSIQGNWAFVS